MTQELIFEQIGENKFAVEFPSPGRCAVEIARNEDGLLSISARLADRMPSVYIPTKDVGLYKHAIFELNIPKGVIITIESATIVQHAVIMVEDEQ